ncbi:hypothetical protein HBDW_46020 [Herbaspirillum sp. DW155]|uniref:hypothetical protein n=1 Tax=Herbaspirillum sp. DW155 TaxID=3095609 RepID=UPI00308FDC96|nr:hypothetical protein HBDW_46020 [Herbaspirillum sp. DW155]
MQKINYHQVNGRYAAAKDGELFRPGAKNPAVYFLVRPDSTAPFYVGEYGKAATYDVVERIRRHFGATGTLRRVALNMGAYGYDLPTEFTAYVKMLGPDYQDVERRTSLEAWLIHILCHDLKKQSSEFCVVKHNAPLAIYRGEKAVARQILAELMGTVVEEEVNQALA